MNMHVATLDDLARVLTQLHERRGLSMRAVAFQTKINPGTLKNWMLGKHWPQLDTFARLVAFYGATVTIGHDPEAGES